MATQIEIIGSDGTSIVRPIGAHLRTWEGIAYRRVSSDGTVGVQDQKADDAYEELSSGVIDFGRVKIRVF